MKTRLVLLLVLLSVLPAHAQPRTPPTIDPRALLHAMEEAFTTVADRATPAVVNVSTVPRKQPAEEAPERFLEFFGEEFNERVALRRPRVDTAPGRLAVLVDAKRHVSEHMSVRQRPDSTHCRPVASCRLEVGTRD